MLGAASALRYNKAAESVTESVTKSVRNQRAQSSRAPTYRNSLSIIMAQRSNIGLFVK
jgi:hypothetical protein